MQKLRMIVTSVIVLTVFGSAFAFKERKKVFCVVIATNVGVDCTTYIKERKQVATGGTEYKHFPNWDGDGNACTAANNGLCTVLIKLVLD